MPESPNWWDEFRSKMPVVEKWAYFDHAGVSPLPGPIADVLIEFARDNAANGVVSSARWRATVETARACGAKLLGADQDEIAVIHNTTEGIYFIADGFPWRPGDIVVTLASEFPSNLYPWMNLKGQGVETRCDLNVVAQNLCPPQWVKPQVRPGGPPGSRRSAR